MLKIFNLLHECCRIKLKIFIKRRAKGGQGSCSWAGMSMAKGGQGSCSWAGMSMAKGGQGSCSWAGMSMAI